MAVIIVVLLMAVGREVIGVAPVGVEVVVMIDILCMINRQCAEDC